MPDSRTAVHTSLHFTPSSPSERIHFADVTERAGIDFTLGHGGRTPLTILETAGGGCAFLDYDGDGWPDILLVGPFNVSLYRNLGNGRFADVTRASGLDQHRYWMGCAVGDYDGDGKPDIFLTGYRCCALYHNDGSGRFSDVTKASGIGGLEWSLSAVFADLSGDGRLDLFVSQYLKFDPATHPFCRVGNVISACGPEEYQPLSGKLFINVDGRHFQEAPWKDSGKTWGALASDLLGTGRPSLYLANDMVPGDLWTRDGKEWKNFGAASGTAYDAQGHIQGGMAVDSGDYDNDGRLDLLVTTYFAQQKSLYHNDGNGMFTVASGPSGLGPPTMPYVGFGAVFADFDNDGWQDIIITNGHVRDNVHDFDASQTYAQPVQVFRNTGGRFQDCSATIGDLASRTIVGRGLAIADYNRDGRTDVLICNLEGKAVLLENASRTGHWLDVRLQEKGLNRFGLGAVVRMTAGAVKLIREVRTSGSVLSSSEPVAHFGLGDYLGLVHIDVTWPDGTKQSVSTSRLDAVVTVSR